VTSCEPFELHCVGSRVVTLAAVLGLAYAIVRRRILDFARAQLSTATAMALRATE